MRTELHSAADTGQQSATAVSAAGQAARSAAASLRAATADGLNEALRLIARRLADQAAAVLAANADDVRAARQDGLAEAFVDRLTLD